MDSFRNVRWVGALLIVLFLLEVALILLMFPVRSFLTWAVAATQAVVVLYFAVLSLGLIREGEDRGKGEGR